MAPSQRCDHPRHQVAAIQRQHETPLGIATVSRNGGNPLVCSPIGGLWAGMADTARRWRESQISTGMNCPGANSPALEGASSYPPPAYPTASSMRASPRCRASSRPTTSTWRHRALEPTADEIVAREATCLALLNAALSTTVGLSQDMLAPRSSPSSPTLSCRP